MLKDCIAFLKGQGYDLVIVETAGIGQSDSEIVDLVDFPVYVMTSEYGAASQLRKNRHARFRRTSSCSTSSTNAARKMRCATLRKQWKQSNRVAFKLTDEQVPVYPTIASQFNDPGVTWMFANLCRLLREEIASRCEQVDPACRHHAEGTTRDGADPRQHAFAISPRSPRARPKASTRASTSKPKPPIAHKVISTRCAKSTRICRTSARSVRAGQFVSRRTLRCIARMVEERHPYGDRRAGEERRSGNDRRTQEVSIKGEDRRKHDDLPRRRRSPQRRRTSPHRGRRPVLCSRFGNATTMR